MSRMSPLIWLLGVLLTQAQLLAVEKDWNRSSDGLWSDNLNWSPNGVPNSSDVAFLGRGVFPSGYLTTLNIDDIVGGLTVLNGSRFSTADRQLQVNGGLTTIDGVGSAIFLTPRTTSDFDSLDAEGVSIRNGGRLSLDGGILELESGLLDIGTTGGGTLDGHGTVELVETGLGGSSALVNNGTIRMGRGLFDSFNLNLTITNTDTAGGGAGSGGVDLDGTTGNGIVDIDDGTGLLSGNLTLVIDAQITDAFDGTMDIGQGDTIDMRNGGNPWALGTSGVLNLNGGGGVATLKGQGLAVGNGSVINVNAGEGRIESPLTVINGQILVGPSGTLHLANTSSIAPTRLLFNGPSSGLEVSGTTNIVDAGNDFDWDGQGGGATTTVSGNGRLNISVDNIDLNNDLFEGNINLEDDGHLSVHRG